MYRLVAALALGVMLASPTAGAEIECANPMLTVQAEDRLLATRVCTKAEEFLDSVDHCGLRLLSPIQIHIMRLIDPEQPDCLARFRCETGELLIVPLDRLRELDVFDAPFAAIPADALFDSLVAHELTHGLLYQAAPGLSRVKQEYLAHAFQISMLPEQVREAFLDNTQFEGPRSALVSLTVLRFFPAYFASASWGFFEESGGHCTAVRDVLEGLTPF